MEKATLSAIPHEFDLFSFVPFIHDEDEDAAVLVAVMISVFSECTCLC